jgi:hypothetical protein
MRGMDCRRSCARCITARVRKSLRVKPTSCAAAIRWRVWSRSRWGFLQPATRCRCKWLSLPALAANTGRATFAGRSFTSFQSAGRGTSAHLLRERFGPLSFDLALVVEGTKLCLVVRRWSLWGLPLPLLLAPGGDSYETVIDDRFHFHVEIRHSLIGLIVGYCGWLEIRPRADAAVLAETRVDRPGQRAASR